MCRKLMWAVLAVGLMLVVAPMLTQQNVARFQSSMQDLSKLQVPPSMQAQFTQMQQDFGRVLLILLAGFGLAEGTRLAHVNVRHHRPGPHPA